MNRGKTTASLGLLALIGLGLATGFTKLFGHRYAIDDGIPAAEGASWSGRPWRTTLTS